MKFAYRFSNLLGTVYRKGNLSFSTDGNRVISPVGNRISVFDLKNNKSETLPVESRLNITAIGLSPDGNLIIAVNEDGEAMLISLISKTVLHYHKFHGSVHAISFSPDGAKFAITKGSMVHVYHAPKRSKEFNPFVPYKSFYGAYDDNVCIDWTSDSRAFCVGSKDMNVRVYGSQRYENLIIYSLGGHNDTIVGAFFEQNSLDLYSVSSNGQLTIYECDTELEGLIPYQKKQDADEENIDEDEDFSSEENIEENAEKRKKKASAERKEIETTEGKIQYKRIAKHSYKEARGAGSTYAKLSTVAYHKSTHILVAGFDDGAFFLHELPEFNLIHSLSISDQVIASVAFNNTGDWIALGCSGLGQLLVWEWQSESYVLKQQGHFNNMSCIAYSPDGQYLVTGGDDGKVKVWNTSSGFCFVTFHEHLAGITGVLFNQRGQVVVSSSLDGTVRAFDLNRYRNFRTFTSPRPVQFSCLALDPSGEIVCAGGLDSFEIFVWSMQTGKLLDVLSSHEGPISSLAFSPTLPILASASWDKTCKLWDVFEKKSVQETLTFVSDVLTLAYRPDGNELAVATLDAQITLWDPHTAQQNGTIEGRHDLGYTRRETDKITAKKSAAGKAFSTLCYTADGECILAGGRAKNVCIYSVKDQMLVKKFEISCNQSFDGMVEFLDRRKMTEWGNLSLVETADGDDKGKALALPGVKKGDMSSRHWKPEVRVSGVQFSPTGRSWAATTTEGILIYSLDQNLIFDPFELDIDITPVNVRKTLHNGEYTTALMLGFRLNEQSLIQEVIEQIPHTDIELLVQNLPDLYVDKLLEYLATKLESSHHLEFYLTWCYRLLMSHGGKLKQRSQSIMAALRAMQKVLTRRYEDIGKICDHNKYSLQYLTSLAQIKKKRKPEKQGSEEEVSSDNDSDDLMGNFEDSDEEITELL